MADIFISYSRKDSEQAAMLTEQLSSSGLSVWIDSRGIEGAEQWATEIVEGINSCTTFLLLLSQTSVESNNVLKELSLASEKGKRILPVELNVVMIPTSFEYQIAGLQRVPISDFDAIVRSHHHGVERKSKKDLRKSLMILPFEDLSPTADNGWFADGIASELITVISNVKALRVADQQAMKEYKRYKGTLPVYAKEMNIRYFVQGDVRKFGDQIKITSRLLDIDTGDYLWQDSMKGTMEDIFEIQETVAQKVVEGLNVILTIEEKEKIAKHGTENEEAYETFLKAQEYSFRKTREGFEIAVELFSDAIRIDETFAKAYIEKAHTLIEIYRLYNRDSDLLDEAERLCEKARQLDPNLTLVLYPLSNIYRYQGKLTEAEEAAQEYVRKAPEDYRSHFILGFFYSQIGEASKSINAYEEVLRLRPEYREVLFNLVLKCHVANEPEKRNKWAMVALPIAARHLRLHPDDEASRMQYANLLHFGGKDDDARREAEKLKDARDSVTLYNIACLLGDLGDKSEALVMFRKAIQAGMRYLSIMKLFLNSEKEGIAVLAGTPEYEEVARMVEEIEREEQSKKNNG